MARIQENNKGQWRFGNCGRWRNQRSVLAEIQESRTALSRDSIEFIVVRSDGSETRCVAFPLGWATATEYEKYQAMRARVA